MITRRGVTANATLLLLLFVKYCSAKALESRSSTAYGFKDLKYRAAEISSLEMGRKVNSKSTIMNQFPSKEKFIDKTHVHDKPVSKMKPADNSLNQEFMPIKSSAFNANSQNIVKSGENVVIPVVANGYPLYNNFRRQHVYAPSHPLVSLRNHPFKDVDRFAEIRKMYIGNRPVRVHYIKASNIPHGHPLRAVLKRRKDEQLKETDQTFTNIFRGLVEIIKDALAILAEMYTDNSFMEKNDVDSNVIELKNESSSWSLIRTTFLKYVNVLQTAEPLQELRKFIPVAKLQQALEKGDQSDVLSVFIQSITSGLFSYAVSVLKDILHPTF